MGSVVLPTLTTKREIDTIIRDTLDKVVVLRFGRASDSSCLHLDDIVHPPFSCHCFLLIVYFFVL
jgi:Mitosis protein DIM1